MVLNYPVTVNCDVLAVSGAYKIQQFIRTWILQAAKDNHAFRVVACHGLAFGWPFSEAQIQL